MEEPKDQPVDIQTPIKEPEVTKDLKVPDDLAGWAIACVYSFDEQYHKETMERADKAFGVYNGPKQWDPDLEKQMKDDKRPVLRFNEVRPKIKGIVGEERRNREDWVARPQEGSDEAEADVRTALLKHVRQINDLEEDESRVFEEAVVGGYGGAVASLVQVTEGEPPLLRMQYRPWREIKWDWNAKRRDWSDAQWVAVTFLAPEDKLRETFPEYKDDIASEYLALASTPLQPVPPEVGERIGVTRYLDDAMRGMLWRPEDRRVRVTEFQYRTMRKRAFLNIVTPNGVTEHPVPDGEAPLAVAQKIHDEGRGVLRKRNVPAIICALIVGRRTLTRWWSPFKGTNAFGIPYFSIFPFISSDTDGYIMGLVEPMISPQEEVNKRWSMMVENYLKQARSGGLVEEYAIEDIKKFEREYGRPGKWQVVKAGALVGAKLKAHTPPPTDMALMQLFQVAEKTMDRVSNINPARLGMGSNETSGIAIRQRAMQSALVQVDAFDNFRHWQLLLGKFINSNLEIMFPVEKTLRLRMPSTGVSQVVVLNQEQIVEGARKVVNSTQGEQFDVVMALTPANTTFREFQAEALADLLGQIGPAMQGNPLLVQPYITMMMGLVQLLENLPNREQILAQMRDAIARVSQPMVPPGPSGLPPGLPGMPETPPPGMPPTAPAVATPPMPPPPGGMMPGMPFAPAAIGPPGPPGQPVTSANLAVPDIARKLAAAAVLRRMQGGG